MRFHPVLRATPALVGAGLLSLPLTARGEADVFGTGDGHLGALSVSAKGAVINVYAPVAENVRAGATDVKIGAAVPAGGTFQAGDLVLLWQAAGLAPAPTSGNQSALDLPASQVGRWELARVQQVESSGAVLRLTQPVVAPGGFAASVTQVVKVPEHTTVSIGSGASVRALPWDGSRGGIVAFLAQGSVALVPSGSITADGAGFRGGLLQNGGSVVLGCKLLDGGAGVGYAAKGEGIASSAYSASLPVLQGGRGNVANGGGGGDCRKAGGAGGGNGGTGGKGGYSWPGESDLGGTRDVGGLGGAPLHYSLISRLSLGGGGGAGHEDFWLGTEGANGGGAIFVRAGSLEGSGRISANGASAAAAQQMLAASDGAGGGGAGGSIVLRFEGDASCTGVSAAGGKGGDGGGDCGPSQTDCQSDGPGGGGAGGRILFQARSKSCATNVKAGLAGLQASSLWPGGAHRGAGPEDENEPTAIGLVEEPPGRYCSSSADCSGIQPVCDTASFCRACTPSDCSGATRACEQTPGAHQGECVECTAANGSACSGAKPLCDSGTNTCVGCRSNADCSGRTPICDASTRLCRACTAASDGADCKPGSGVCVTDPKDSFLGQCVQCVSSADCGTQSCNIPTHTCVNCGSSAQCGNPRPVCDVGGECRPCSDDRQCSLRPGAPLCGQVDPIRGRCVQCTPTNLTFCGRSTPSCDPSTGACVGCTKHADCRDPRAPVCDPSTMACAPCAADRGAKAALACPSAVNPGCQTSGNLAGECTECSPTQTSLCTSDRPACLASLGICGCIADADCGASGLGRSCHAGVCVNGADAGTGAGADGGLDSNADGGADAGADGDGDVGADGGADAGADGGPDAEADGGLESPDGGPARGAISAEGGGISCSTAGPSWTPAAPALTVLLGLVRRRRSSTYSARA